MQTVFGVPILAEFAYAYPDYIILPSQHQNIDPRTISTETRLTDRITLNIPIVGANMGHLGGRMAEQLARLGGIGILSQDFRIEEILTRIRRVKEASPHFHMPIVLSPENSVANAVALMTKRHFDCVIAVDANSTPVGIATRKDLSKLPGWEQLKNVMRQDLVIVPDTISTEQASDLMIQNQIHHLPVVDSQKRLVGCLTPMDITLRLHNYKPALDSQGRLLIGVAMGMKPKEGIAQCELARKYLQAGVDMLVLDVANGYLKTFVDFVHAIRSEVGKEVPIIAGNVADYEGAMRLLEAGCDTVKVGIGPGGACTTRLETGVGVPQASAVADGLRALRQYGHHILADGGIRSYHDLAIAILLGAPAVMIGTLLAGTYESAFETETVQGEMYKRWRGNASSSAATYRRQEIYGEKYITEELEHSEGADGLVKVAGSAAYVIFRLVEGLRQYMAYSNAPNIRDFQSKKNDFLRLKTGPHQSYLHVSELRFDDIYIKPQPSRVASRKDVELSTSLTSALQLKIPYVALPANFIQKKICSIMAQLGGLGFLSKKKPQEDIAKLVDRIKKVKAGHPDYFFPSIQHSDEEIGKTIDFCNENAFSCAIIVKDVQNDLTPIGIATRNDLYNHSRTETLQDVIKTNILTVPEGVAWHVASETMIQKGIHHLPVVNANGQLVGCITPRDITLRVFYKLTPNKDCNGRLRVGAALQITEDDADKYVQEAWALEQAGVDILLLSTDNGYSNFYLHLLRTLRSHLSCPLVASGVSTYEGALSVFEAGADVVQAGSKAIKIPIAEAIHECTRAALSRGKAVISKDDGGSIVYPRDANLSLLMGANAVGLRNILAPTYENSMQTFVGNTSLQSAEAKWVQRKIGTRQYLLEDMEAREAEAALPSKLEGSVINIIVRFLNGLRSSCTYSNAATLNEYQHHAILGLQSPMGYWEGLPHAFVK